MQRNDFKLEQVQPHLFMNFRVVDEHGRQLGMGRHLAALKAELGGQARSAFQALAALKRARQRRRERRAQPSPPSAPVAAGRRAPPRGAAAAAASGERRGAAPAAPPTRYTAWTFGELPELMEMRRGAQALIGFPALIDRGTHVEIEVFDEPEVAAAKHRAGLRRLVALQISEPLKYLEKNIPDLQKMAAAYMALGTLDELREQIIDVALDRAFLADPLPTDARGFKAALEEGRARLTLIAQEVARLAGTVLAEYAAAQRKLKDSRPPKEVADDVAGAAAAPGAASASWRRRPGRAAAPAALPEGHRAAPGQAARRPGARRRRAWPSCARSSSAGCAAWPSCRARATRGWTSSAGCSRNCA